MLLSLSVTAIRTISVGDPCDGMSEKRCFFYLHWASFIICTSVRLTLMHIPLIRELQESLLPEEGRGGHSLPAAQHLFGFRFLIYTFKQNVKNNINPHWKQLNILCITWKTLVFSSILFFFCLFLVYYNKEGIACKILSVFPLYKTMACTFLSVLPMQTPPMIWQGYSQFLRKFRTHLNSAALIILSTPELMWTSVFRA